MTLHPTWLRGWTQIAAYVGLTERTIQRWHRLRPMPIVRLGRHVTSAPALLDAWLIERPLMENGRGTVTFTSAASLCPRCGWPSTKERVAPTSHPPTRGPFRVVRETPASLADQPGIGDDDEEGGP